MGSVGLPPVAEEYFIKCTSLSNRLIQDINYVKEVNGKWNNMSYMEQCKTVDEAIINSSEKYHFYLTEEPYYPKLLVDTGAKYVMDEENGKLTGFRWRDEHSAPFSWETKSQQNLSYSSMECLADEDEPQTCSTEATDTMESQKPSELGFVEVRTRNINGKPEERVSIFGSDFDPPELVLGGSSTALLSELKVRLGEKLTSNTYNAAVPQPKPSLLARGKKLFLRMNLKQFSYSLASSHSRGNDKRSSNETENPVEAMPTEQPKSKPPRPEPPRRDPSTEVSSKLCGSCSSLFSKGTDNTEEAVCLLPDHPKTVMRASTSSDGGTLSQELSPPDGEDMPKTGFAFLDNW